MYWMKINFEMFYVFFFLDFILLLILLIPMNMYNFHPLMLSILLIFYTIFACFKLNLMINSYWYSYIMFLVMVGGVMVIFMYFTSLINNQMIMMNMNYFMKLFYKIFIILLMFYLLMYLNKYMYMYMNMYEWEGLIYLFINKSNELIKYLFMDYILSMNLFILMYLFFMMICSVLICMKNNIPLRQNLK
uniref:NADH dehydrogenase subunit 6 n=1 Tax=Asobara japonica TaxID=554476 RepID=A0A6B9XQA8_9HYME|nr:NADH dehydrogenase subunit 6 [Asobara japonica]QHR84925.1 NADH dehydrogenase subunit 6 [Asobara japonica]